MIRIQSEKGETVAQTVLAVPVLLAVLLLALQITASFHAGNVASAAAVQAARAVAASGANLNAAESVAIATAKTLDSRVLGVVVNDNNGTLTVTVRVLAPSIVPGMGGTVDRSAEVPRERFVSEIERLNQNL
jgi:Flp pilus assembly protein TadG